MRDPDYRAVYQSAGVNRILSEADVFIGALATAIEHDAVTHAMLLGGGNSVAFELALPTEAAVAGRTVGEIASDPEFPSSCVFAGIEEADGTVHAPRGGSTVDGGMTLVLVVRRDELPRSIQFFMRTR
jgi:trk system potassium uptake protein TrkA